MSKFEVEREVEKIFGYGRMGWNERSTALEMRNRHIVRHKEASPSHELLSTLLSP